MLPVKLAVMVCPLYIWCAMLSLHDSVAKINLLSLELQVAEAASGGGRY